MSSSIAKSPHCTYREDEDYFAVASQQQKSPLEASGTEPQGGESSERVQRRARQPNPLHISKLSDTSSIFSDSSTLVEDCSQSPTFSSLEVTQELDENEESLTPKSAFALKEPPSTERCHRSTKSESFAMPLTIKRTHNRTTPPQKFRYQRLSNTSTESLPSARTTRFKETKIPLPVGSTLVSWENFQQQLQDGAVIVDARPFHEYCHDHIKGAINMCLPSTLLRRETFTLEKCIQTLTNDERAALTPVFERNPPSILFYDNSTSSSDRVPPSVSHLVSKFSYCPTSQSKLYVLDGGLNEFLRRWPEHITTTSNANSKPALSHFVLPEQQHDAFFKMRHQEELLTSTPNSEMHINTEIIEPEKKALPKWLQKVVSPDDQGASTLCQKFNALQIEERNRLNQAMSRSASTETEFSTDGPVLAAGIELGSKNRYKDIFPYEHARVKIQKYAKTDSDLDQESSYINASYLHYAKSPLHYIASQGPLKETIGDFWRVIYENSVPLVLSLTQQTENHMEKCAPYWEPGTYWSNGISVTISVEEVARNFKLLKDGIADSVIRRFSVQVGEKPPHEVLQVHVLTWDDYGASVINTNQLLSLVSLKRYVLQQTHTEHSPVLVHCSAGCGRTGCFCSIDTCIDMILGGSENFDRDMVYDVVSQFRTQRVSMVQNLRQYILVYDTILKLKKNQWQGGDALLVDWSKHKSQIIEWFIKRFNETV